MSKSDDFAPAKPIVQEQIETLMAIQDYNKSLPKARRKKDSLPEINTSNVSTSHRIKKDPKKGTVEVVTKYHQIGIVDGCVKDEFSDDAFSLASKQRQI